MKKLLLALAPLSLAASPVLAQSASPQNLAAHDPGDRQASIEALQATTYDLIALSQATHQMHWNLVGPNFYQLHEMLGEFYQAQNGMFDVTAERMRTLGSPADGRLTASAQQSRLPEPPVAELNGIESVRQLAAQYKAVSDRINQRIDATGDTDPSSQDVLIDASRMIDKQLWMLTAHLR